MFAATQENGVAQLLMLRLKVESGKVKEAEALVQRRQTSRLINTDGLTLDPLWGESSGPATVPAGSS